MLDLKNVSINFLPKKYIYPKFGINFSPNIICVYADLPKIIQTFIIYHELYHLHDKETNWIIREIKANIYGAIRCPIGFLYTFIYSLNKDRINYYIKRFQTWK